MSNCSFFLYLYAFFAKCKMQKPNTDNLISRQPDNPKPKMEYEKTNANLENLPVEYAH